MKLVAFSLVYFSIIVSLSGYRFPWRAAFVISILYVLILRLGGFQGDFQVYLEELRTGWLSAYYLREPLFWVGSKIIFLYSGNERLVIFVYDLFFCFFLYKAVKKVADVNVFFILLVSFPVFLGLENVYRQVLGLPLSFLFIYHCFSGRFAVSLFYLILATLFHNSYIVLAPMLIFSVSAISSGLRISAVILFFAVALALVGYMGISVEMAGKSSAQSTGLSLEYLYAAVIIFSCISIAPFLQRDSGKWFVTSVIVNFVYFLSMSTLGSSQSERVGMILILALFYSYFCLTESGLRWRNSIVKVQLFSIMAIPVFVFSSTRYFLVSGGN